MRVLRQHRRQPRGASAAPVSRSKPLYLPQLIGHEVELYLQGQPLAQDECEVGYVLYVTSSWVGFVTAFRAQIFYDHIPVSSIRKIRGAVYRKRKPQTNPIQNCDFDDPQKLTDLIGSEVVLHLQGEQLLRDAAFKTRLTYVKKNWIGCASVFSNRLLPDHIPLSTIRKITKVVLRDKPGRFTTKVR